MKTQKILALFMAVVMVFGLCTTAFAATGEKVQINNMMIDKSLVDLAAFGLEEETEEPIATLSVASTTDLEQNENYPPISQIGIEGFTAEQISSSAGIKQGQAVYNITVPAGTTANQLTNKTVSFILGGTSSTQAGSLITISYGGQNYSATAGGTISIQMTLLDRETKTFTISWITSAGEQQTKNCRITAIVPVDTTNVSLTRLTIGSTDATISSSTVGGVTRYSCVAELENITSLEALTVVATLGSGNANATLGGVNGTKSGNEVTFTNADLTSNKELIVTNTTYSRTYQVSAYIEGQTVEVCIAIRTYTVFDWLDGTSATSTNYYDYVANGYGSGADLTETERTQFSNIASALAGNNAPNAPIRSEGNKRIFDEDSYIALDVSADSNVMEVLNMYLSESGLYASISGGSYVSAMGTSTSAQIGEFDCGYASGWMYTVRNAVDDLDTALPNAGANTWPVYDGMFIDWYYTAAYGADFGYSMFDL